MLLVDPLWNMTPVVLSTGTDRHIIYTFISSLKGFSTSVSSNQHYLLLAVNAFVIQYMFSWDNWSFFPPSEILWNSRLDVLRVRLGLPIGCLNFYLVFCLLKVIQVYSKWLYHSCPPFLLFCFRLVFIRTKMKTNTLRVLWRCCFVHSPPLIEEKQFQWHCQHLKWASWKVLSMTN